MKEAAKKLVVEILGWQVRRLNKKAKFKTIVVAGSIGKTTTKHAIAATLAHKHKVQYQKGNYNVLLSVPLVFFGLPIPSLINPLAWIKTFLLIEKQLRRPYLFDVVVIEIGTDAPGDIAQFKKYLRADIGVVTAIAPEHMAFFKTLDAVAKEELSLESFSDRLLINTDLCDKKYLDLLLNDTYVSYGRAGLPTYKFNYSGSPTNFRLAVSKNGEDLIRHDLNLAATSQLSAAVAAVAVADMLGLDEEEIKKGIATIKPTPGRMNLLKGIKDSVLIDDTYNASPEAAKAALQTLYATRASQKIALLGNMNELGAYSKTAHTEIGKLCDPKEIDLLVTLGKDANLYLAGEAEKRSCNVVRTQNPVEAGKKIAEVIRKDAAVLVKGSQNGVFAEEAVKLLLANKKDEKYLVRQSSDWMEKKSKWLKEIAR